MNLYSIDQNGRNYVLGDKLVRNVRFVHVSTGIICELMNHKEGGVRNMGAFLNDSIAMQVAKRDYSGSIYPCPYCMGKYRYR